MFRALFILFSTTNITVSLFGLFNDGDTLYLVNLFYTIFALIIFKKLSDFVGKVEKNSRDIKNIQKDIETLKTPTPETQTEHQNEEEP